MTVRGDAALHPRRMLYRPHITFRDSDGLPKQLGAVVEASSKYHLITTWLEAKKKLVLRH